MLSRENEEHIKLLPQNIADLAENYARKMKSNDLGKETDILSLFENFKTRYNTKTLSGELRETKYIELVAQKND